MAEESKEKAEETEVETEKAEHKAKKTTKATKGGIMSKDEIITAIKNMTVLELADLTKALQAEFDYGYPVSYAY